MKSPSGFCFARFFCHCLGLCFGLFWFWSGSAIRQQPLRGKHYLIPASVPNTEHSAWHISRAPKMCVEQNTDNLLYREICLWRQRMKNGYFLPWKLQRQLWAQQDGGEEATLQSGCAGYRNLFLQAMPAAEHWMVDYQFAPYETMDLNKLLSSELGLVKPGRNFN